MVRHGELITVCVACASQFRSDKDNKADHVVEIVKAYTGQRSISDKQRNVRRKQPLRHELDIQNERILGERDPPKKAAKWR